MGHFPSEVYRLTSDLQRFETMNVQLGVHNAVGVFASHGTGRHGVPSGDDRLSDPCLDGRVILETILNRDFLFSEGTIISSRQGVGAGTEIRMARRILPSETLKTASETAPSNSMSTALCESDRETVKRKHDHSLLVSPYKCSDVHILAENFDADIEWVVVILAGNIYVAPRGGIHVHATLGKVLATR